MECKFIVGQDVVCIMKGEWFCENPDWNEPLDIAHPEFQAVYKITHIHVGASGDVYLQFAEFLNSYNARSFRPVQKRETDISWAHEILHKATTKELV